MADKVKHVTDATYQQEVLEADRPVLVDFGAPWCGPCVMIAPVIEQLADEYQDKVVFVQLNVDENPDTPGKLGIRGIPTLILYMNGAEAERLVGFAPKAKLQSKIDAVLEIVAQ